MSINSSGKDQQLQGCLIQGPEHESVVLQNLGLGLPSHILLHHILHSQEQWAQPPGVGLALSPAAAAAAAMGTAEAAPSYWPWPTTSGACAFVVASFESATFDGDDACEIQGPQMRSGA